ncbi:hypothetical protein B0A50_00028 [Salinomyces thailandicus]|uniref:Uncharacterized protein n=1 Tax=Salinomyces thailandicus TaxID=706561 RepID=A0A4U0UET0_9PEZI|nr:hypothetical protein B0A50_00028 [Salinomyces thailandica]
MLRRLTCLLGLGPLVASAVAQNEAECSDGGYVNPCKGYAVDFASGGSYFQNISSTANFTFAGQFEGCQNDTANNILVDPDGDEYYCSDTNLTPDDETQTSKCPIEKDDMYSGDWSVLIISNNGDGCPIALERDFTLTVAEPVTETYTPTVTLPITVTPIVNVTTTTTSTISVTISSTVTSAEYTLEPTTTVTPTEVTHKETKTFKIPKKAFTAVPVVKTIAITRACIVPDRATTTDKKATITPTLVTAAALQTSNTTAASRPRIRRLAMDRRGQLADKKTFIAERRAWLEENGQLGKRGLDSATTTITETNTSSFKTTTTTTTASASTMTITTVKDVTTTITATATVLSGNTTLSQATVAAATPTRTKTAFTVVPTTVKTVTFHPTITIHAHTAAASATASCSSKGGVLS